MYSNALLTILDLYEALEVDAAVVEVPVTDEDELSEDGFEALTPVVVFIPVKLNLGNKDDMLNGLLTFEDGYIDEFKLNPNGFVPVVKFSGVNNAPEGVKFPPDIILEKIDEFCKE